MYDMEVLSVNAAGHRPTFVGAGFWIRVLARLLDSFLGIIMGTIVGIVGVLTLTILQRSGVIDSGWQEVVRSGGISISGFILSSLGSVFYHSSCEGIYGASLGKLVCGLRVLSDDGNPCDFEAAIVRSLAFFVDALFFGWIAYMSMEGSVLNQRNGDKWARTVVVKQSQVPGSSRRSVDNFVFAFLLGVGVWGGLVFLEFIWRAY